MSRFERLASIERNLTRQIQSAAYENAAAAAASYGLEVATVLAELPPSEQAALLERATTLLGWARRTVTCQRAHLAGQLCDISRAASYAGRAARTSHQLSISG